MKLILLAGDLATGKSSFAEILSKRYSIPSYTKDEIKELLSDEIGFSNREDNLKLSKASVKLMTLIYEKHSVTGKDLILEANFHSDETKRLYALAEKNGDDVLTLLFEADTDILYRRFRHRIEFENRHPAHQSAGLNSIETFEKYILKSRENTFLRDFIKVNADDFSYQSDSDLLKRIDSFIRHPAQ